MDSYDVRRALILAVFDRENAMCFYCSRSVSLTARKYLTSDHSRARLLGAATFDHIVPRSRGGADSVDNGVLACVQCNGDRADRPAVDFLYERLAGAIA